MNEIFDRILKGIRDPKEDNPYHKENVERDKKKAYDALTEPRTARDKKERDDNA